MAECDYDGRGHWIRTDRPEMLSDRLGYPSVVGDEDWARIKAARDQAQSDTRPGTPTPSGDDQ